MAVEQFTDIESILSKFSLKSSYYVKFLSLLLFAGVTNAFYSVNYVFAASGSEYRCKYQSCKHNELMAVLNLSLSHDTCQRFPYIEEGNCSVENLDPTRTVLCEEWVYDNENSFVSEFNLGCQDWKRTLVGTSHSFGYMIGLLILGPLADKIGRKKMIIMTGITAAAMGLGRSIVTSYWAYIALEFIEALLGDTYSTTFMLGVEMVTKENRVAFITLMTAGTSLAGILMALIAWALPYWRSFLRAIYGPSIAFILYIFLLDESLRWLIIQGRKDDVKHIIKRAAISNNIVVDDIDLDKIESDKVPSGTHMRSLLMMTFSSKKLLFRFLACICMWITGLFNKYALLINSVELEGNKYINFGLTTFSELPASFVLGYLLRKFKRKLPLIVSFGMTGIFCVGQSLVPKGHVAVSTSLFLLGKFTATISYATVYLYTSELFPTYTRNTMHALCSSMGRIATMVAPQTPLLIKYWTGLPSVMVGGLSLVTGVIVIFMPDTADEILPDTVQEAEAVGCNKNDETYVTKF